MMTVGVEDGANCVDGSFNWMGELRFGSGD